MRYLFGDSTEFPMQKDFLGLLNNFIDISAMSIRLDNDIYHLKENIEDRNVLKNCVVNSIEDFSSNIDNTISKSIEKSKYRSEIVECTEKVKEILSSNIEDGKTRFLDNISQEIMLFDSKISDAEEENKKILGPFFSQTFTQMISNKDDPNNKNNKSYTVVATKEGYSIRVQTDHVSGISYLFDSIHEPSLWGDYIKVSDLIKGLKIPVRMKKSFFRRELVPDVVDIDDYIISDIKYSGNEIEIVVKNSIDNMTDRFRMKISTTNSDIYYGEDSGEEEIISIPELKDKLDTSKLYELREKIMEYIDNISLKEIRLDAVCLDGVDTIRNNKVFELMSKIAEIIFPTIVEIKKRSLSTEELSLKEENDIGERKEIYIKKSQIKEKLGDIKEKGDMLYQKLIKD